jgi:hypothetical protein
MTQTSLEYAKRPTVCVTGGGAGVENAWEQETREGRKLPGTDLSLPGDGLAASPGPKSIGVFAPGDEGGSHLGELFRSGLLLLGNHIGGVGL